MTTKSTCVACAVPFVTPLLVTVFTLPSSISATVIYDESVTGDLVLGSDVGTLGLGTNTVLGSGAMFYSYDGVVTADVDSGIFWLTDGLIIESISATISDIYAIGHASLSDRLTFVESPSDLKIYQNEMISQTVQVNLLPYFESGGYEFFTGGGASSMDPGSELHWNWRIDVATKPVSVPEPGTLSLLGAGLLTLLVRRRRPS